MSRAPRSGTAPLHGTLAVLCVAAPFAAGGGGAGCQYFMPPTAGTCEASVSHGPGAYAIISAAECCAAAMQLQATTWDKAEEEHVANWPYGCYVHEKENDKVYVNTDTRAFEDCTKDGVQCICASAGCAATSIPSTSRPTPTPPPPTGTPSTPEPLVAATPSPASRTPVPVPATPAPVPATPGPPLTTAPAPLPTTPIAIVPITPANASETERPSSVAGGVAVATVVTGLVVGSPVGGSIGLLFVAGGTSCGGGDALAAAVLHPLAFEVRGSRAAGAVVGNTALTAAAWVAVALLVRVGDLCAAPSWWFPRAIPVLRLPVHVFLSLLPGTAYACALLVVQHTGGVAAIGLGGCGVLLGVCGSLLREVRRQVPHSSSGAHGAAYFRHASSDGEGTAWWRVFLCGHGQWVSAAPNCHWAVRYQGMLRSFTQAHAWWAAFDMGLAGLISVCKAVCTGGAEPVVDTTSGNFHLLAAIGLIACLLADMRRFPYAVQRDGAVVFLYRVLLIAVLACLSVGYHSTPSSIADYLAAAESISFAALGVLVAKVVVDTGFAIHAVCLCTPCIDQQSVWIAAGGDGTGAWTASHVMHAPPLDAATRDELLRGGGASSSDPALGVIDEEVRYFTLAKGETSSMPLISGGHPLLGNSTASLRNAAGAPLQRTQSTGSSVPSPFPPHVMDACIWTPSPAAPPGGADGVSSGVAQADRAKSSEVQPLGSGSSTPDVCVTKAESVSDGEGNDLTVGARREPSCALSRGDGSVRSVTFVAGDERGLATPLDYDTSHGTIGGSLHVQAPRRRLARGMLPDRDAAVNLSVLDGMVPPRRTSASTRSSAPCTPPTDAVDLPASGLGSPMPVPVLHPGAVARARRGSFLSALGEGPQPQPQPQVHGRPRAWSTSGRGLVLATAETVAGGVSSARSTPSRRITDARRDTDGRRRRNSVKARSEDPPLLGDAAFVSERHMVKQADALDASVPRLGALNTPESARSLASSDPYRMPPPLRLRRRSPSARCSLASAARRSATAGDRSDTPIGSVQTSDESPTHKARDPAAPPPLVMVTRQRSYKANHSAAAASAAQQMTYTPSDLT